MKVFKKFATVALAAVTALSVAAFAGCDNSKNSGSKVDGAIEAATSQETKYISALFNLTSDSDEKYEYVHADGTAAENPYGSDFSDKSLMEITADIKADLSKGDADIAITMVTGTGEETAAEDEEETDNAFHMYAFMREWLVSMVTGSGEEITDFSQYQLSDIINVQDAFDDAIADIIGSIGGGSTPKPNDPPTPMADAPAEGETGSLDLGTLASNLIMPVLGGTVLGFANSMDAVKVDGDVITADLNLAVYNLVNKIKAILNGIKDDTTIGDVLKTAEAKCIANFLLTGVEAKDIYDGLAPAVEELLKTPVQGDVTIGDMLTAMEIDAANLVPEVKKGESAYDYILRVLSGKEIAKIAQLALASMQDESTTPTIPLDAENLLNTKVVPVLALLNVNIETVKTAFAAATAGISATAITVPEEVSDIEGNVSFKSELGGSTVISGLKAVYTLKSGKISKIEMQFAYNRNVVEASETSVEGVYEKATRKSETSGSVTIDILASAPDLEDVSKLEHVSAS